MHSIYFSPEVRMINAFELKGWLSVEELAVAASVGNDEALDFVNEAIQTLLIEEKICEGAVEYKIRNR